MKKFLIPLSVAALTLVAIGAGAVETPVQVAAQSLDFPTNAQDNDEHYRQVAVLAMDDEYPAPSGDGDSPDIRFPGVPSP